MKAERLLMSISLLAVLLLFSGCGKELENMTIPETGSGVESPDGSDQAEGEILRLQVSDAGFSDANTGSRAIDEGLTTKFEDGDQIGLFVVDSQNKILYANVPYTKDGDAWTAKENIRTKGYPVRVFAYYPYVPDDEIIEKIDSTADNYSDFFKTYIEGLDISNQSSLADYRKADVMACMVEVESKEEARQPLTLGMNHLMVLVMINLPGEIITNTINYKISGKSDYVWSESYPANLSEEKIHLKALREGNGYRYLYRPGEISFSGEFYTNEMKKSYSVSGVTLEAGKCKTYNITLSKTLEQTIEIGDYYLNDGSLRSKGDFLTDEEKQKCVGIVYYTGKFPNNVDGKNHALVVGLKDYHENNIPTKLQWSSVETITGAVGTKGAGFVGYIGTNTLQKYKNDPNYPIVNKAYPVLAVTLPYNKTSSWYIPSIDELITLSINVNNVNSSLDALGSSLAHQIFAAYYWSTGEADSENVSYVFVSGGDYVHTYVKRTFENLRLIFAF